MTRRPFLRAVAAAALSVSFAQPALAQAPAFPTKPLKFVVPFPAGSATDNVARIVAQAMGEQLGQPIAVENKPGANGILGAEQVKSAPADGYTLLVTTNTTQAANLSLYRKLPYDPVKDFTPIGKIGVTGFILMVRPDFPATTLREFIAWGKANPGKLNYGHGSAGSLVSGALLAQMAGIDAQGVAYKGIPPALTDLIGGSLQFAFADVGNAVAQMNGGKLRGLGVTTGRRAGRAPNVPTIAEAGVPGYEVEAWFGLMAPAQLPAGVQPRLTSALLAVLGRPEVREKIAGAGVDVDAQDSATLARTIDAEIRRWAKWVKDAGIQPE
ncbi:MAG TPA: tripartite tricarboxylate transporter substrate binding protein [Quisquiliibacterium sp.]|jgi:tripartite-type tricarboxylate transporter receptor subunit TctC|nr:MAG: tripartite tricarboxylate transporter substrate binding protein [Burkholderiaceae bacterium]HPA89018.1 tripartite tricarboxylate transporter substrate binding protein [Quisquiliibacterium sp.]HQD84283.1 tripartite tricarboxylate transporter substrate binding protein [Quisquiliibacterium sp.]HQN11049.1 tripartite tricarboxylate transporter substrate binding protein [Quisquiliibacterium sp.]HQP65159.1 tripartite tricarboxylate transporter substrate binding protein [Quisquiliibacterium sp.